MINSGQTAFFPCATLAATAAMNNATAYAAETSCMDGIFSADSYESAETLTPPIGFYEVVSSNTIHCKTAIGQKLVSAAGDTKTLPRPQRTALDRGIRNVQVAMITSALALQGAAPAIDPDGHNDDVMLSVVAKKAPFGSGSVHPAYGFKTEVMSFIEGDFVKKMLLNSLEKALGDKSKIPNGSRALGIRNGTMIAAASHIVGHDRVFDFLDYDGSPRASCPEDFHRLQAHIDYTYAMIVDMIARAS